MSDLRIRIVAGDTAIKKGHMDMICDAKSFTMIYGKIERMTGNKDTATKVSSWAEIANAGEIYEFSDGYAIIEKVG